MPEDQGRNPKLSRLHNRALAFKLIIQAGSLSRKDLADRMGLTQAAITRIAEELIQWGLIRENTRSAQDRRPGRKPTPLSVNPETFRIATIQIGRRHLNSYLSDAGAGIIHKREESSRPLLTASDGAKPALLRHVQRLIDEWNVANSGFFAIAVAAPGPINAGENPAAGKLRKRYAHPYLWDDLRGFLARNLKCPVFAENDSNLMALGEQWFGSGKGCKNFVVYNIGEGIGAAAVIDDMLYRGHNNVVAEIGHACINMGGPRCSCGNRGCLELYAGFARLREAFLTAFPERKPGSYDRDLAALFARARDGDSRAGKVIAAHAETVSIGAVSLGNLFSPEKIIVAAFEGDWLTLTPFVEAMQRNVKKRAFSAIENRIAVDASSLGPDIMVYGGVALVMSELLSTLERFAV